MRSIFDARALTDCVVAGFTVVSVHLAAVALHSALKTDERRPLLPTLLNAGCEGQLFVDIVGKQHPRVAQVWVARLIQETPNVAVTSSRQLPRQRCHQKQSRKSFENHLA